MRPAINRGLLFGAAALHLSVVGVLLMLHQRWIVVDTISLGQATLALLAVGAGVMATPAQLKATPGTRLLWGMVSGACAAVPLVALITAMEMIRLQSIFIALSGDLLSMLTFGQQPVVGGLLLLACGAMMGVVGAGLRQSPAAVRKAVIAGASAVVVAGVFQELIQLMLQFEGPVGELRDFVYTWEGLTQQGALCIFVVAVLVSVIHTRVRGGASMSMTDQQRQRQRIIGGVALSWRARVAAGARGLLYWAGADACWALHPDGHGS